MRVAKLIKDGAKNTEDSARIKAAQDLAGPGIEDLKDTAANLAFKTPTSIAEFLKPSPRRLTQLALGSGAYAAGNQNPEAEAAMGMGAALLEPGTHKYALAYGSKLGSLIGRPLLDSLTNAGVRQNAWSLFRKNKEQK